MHAPYKGGSGASHALALGEQAVSALRGGGWVLQSLILSHAIRDGQRGHAEETQFWDLLPPFFLPIHSLSEESGWRHAHRERAASAVLWATEGREVCTQMDELHG